MKSPKQYLLATRPWSFVVSAMPVLATIAYLYWCGYAIRPLTAVWALVGIVLFHAAGNTLSDYYDYKKGLDTADTYGAHTITSGEFAPKEMLRFALVLLAVACISGVGLLLLTGWELLIYGGLGVFFTVAYSWLKAHALGDVDVFFNFGVLPALGTSFVATGAVVWDSLWVVLAIVPITNAVLHCNNTRDVPTDSQAGATTLARLIGKKASVVLYCAMVSMPCLWVVIGVAIGKMPLIALFILCSAKMVWRNCKTMVMFLHDADAINMLDTQTAQQQLISGLLFSLSLFIAKLASGIALL